jgi:hypothetical protein
MEIDIGSRKRRIDALRRANRDAIREMEREIGLVC